MKAVDFAKKYWLPLGGAIIATILVVFVVIPWIVGIAVTNTGNKKQQDLIARYNQTTNVLSDCLVKTKQDVGLVNAQTAAFDKIITNAVTGRYTEGSTAQPGTGSALFSAIMEAYPNLDGLSKTFQDVMVTINGCRTDLRTSQAEMQKAAARFVQWRDGSWWVRNFGGEKYPNEALIITVNNKNVTGKDALAQMRTLIVVSEAQKGRDSGIIENPNPFEPTTN